MRSRWWGALKPANMKGNEPPPTEKRYGGSKILLGSLLLFYAVVYFHRVMTGVMKVEIDSIAELYKVDANVLLALLSSTYYYAYTVA